MTETELLTKVKKGLGISGTYQDDTLQVHIDTVKAFMRDAGVAETVVNDAVSVGCILAGVNDLWNYSSGGVTFSDFFNKRVIQLAVKLHLDQHFDIEETTSALTVEAPIHSRAIVGVYKNGTPLAVITGYTVSGQTISFVSPLAVNDKIDVYVYY